MGRRGRRFAAGFAGLLVLSAVVVASDVWTPSRVEWERAELAGVRSAERADGLVLQEQRGREVWASIGYSIYRSRDGGPFDRVFTLRAPAGEPWGGYSRWLRDRFGYQELVEVVPLGAQELVVFGGGGIYRVDLVRGTQEETFRLRYFGRGEGRGVMPHGITVDDTGSIYFGEYPTAPASAERTIRIHRSDDRGKSWQVAFEFAGALAVRHVHGVQWDAGAGLLWVTTGDADGESRIGYSRDRGRSFTWIASGAQEFRVCSLLFFPDAVVWGPDAVREHNPVYRWVRGTSEATPTRSGLPGPTFFAQRISDHEGVVGLAELAAEAWQVSDTGSTTLLARWSMPADHAGRPHPGVRLARGDGGDGAGVLLNPLRTVETAGAIYRVGR